MHQLTILKVTFRYSRGTYCMLLYKICCSHKEYYVVTAHYPLVWGQVLLVVQFLFQTFLLEPTATQKRSSCSSACSLRLNKHSLGRPAQYTASQNSAGTSNLREISLRVHTEVFLDSVENIHAVLAVHHVDSQSSLAKATCAPDPVQVSLVIRISIFIHRKVKIDNNRDLLYIDPW